MRRFFGIKEKEYIFEWGDVSAFLTLVNVTLIIAGFWFAPLFGLTNCALSVVLNVRNKAHINMYLIHIALVALNVYFLM